MSVSRWALAGVLGLAAAGAAAIEPQVDGQRSYATPQYTLVTHDRTPVRKLPLAFTKIDAVLGTFTKGEAPRRGMPTYIYVARHSVWNDYLLPGIDYSSEFIPGRFANYLVIDNYFMDGEPLRRAVYHEYARLFLRMHAQGFLPLWYEDGFGGLIGRTDFYKDVATIRPPHYRYARRMSVERMLRVDRGSLEYHDPHYLRSFKLLSWSMVHKAMLADPAFGRQVAGYLDALNNGQSIDAALASGFGMTAAQLDEEMGAHLNRASIEAIRVEIQYPPPPNLGAGSPMSRMDALEFLLDIMLTSGSQPHRLADVIEAARNHGPESARSTVLAMRLAARDANDVELRRLLGTLEPAATDPRIARGAGLALFERVRAPRVPMDDTLKAHFESSAFDLLDRALDAHADDAEATWGYATLAARLARDLPEAMRRVRQALQSVPLHGDLNMAGALVAEASGDQTAMTSFLNDTARFSTELEQRAWARQRLAAAIPDAHRNPEGS